MAETELSAIDRNALERAMFAARAESPARSRQLDKMLSTRPWWRVAKFAAYSSQIESLGLTPYQNPPMYARAPDLEKPFNDPRGEREAAEIRQKLRMLGLSTFEPFPLAAIAEAEQRNRWY
jgi:hypothetical protein